jgi:hypothetical protein
MAKAGDNSRLVEAAAHRKVDTALEHLESWQYESGCLRSAARRCRSFPTPELDKLRPNLCEIQGEGSDPQDEDQSTDSSGLVKRLEAERNERQRLDAELQELEKVKAKELEVIHEMQSERAELANLLRNGLRGLEPAMNKIVEQSRPSDVERPDESALNSLPGCLRLVFAKFENIVAFSKSSGVSVRIEGLTARGDGEPAEKKARKSEDGKTEVSVCVQISAGIADKATASKQAFGLRFTSPGGEIIHVAPLAPGAQGNALLASLWPEDDGRKTTEPAGSAESLGRAYYWAQVLAGLRETVSTSVAPLATVDAVSAMDIITRVRAKLVAK